MGILKFKNADGNWESVETPGAIKYTEQVLTEEQKAQARANIGIGDVEVDSTALNSMLEEVLV